MAKNNNQHFPPKNKQKIFVSGNTPEHVESKYILFKKPDSAPKIRIPASGKKKLSF